MDESDRRNLSFSDKHDIANWKERCADQRRIAETFPAYDKRMSSVEEYGWVLGPWSLRLVLEIWQKPYMWHASAAVMEQVAYETVTMPNGIYAGTRIEVPQDALLATRSWVPEHMQQARFILGEVLGPILRPGDKHQLVNEHIGLWAMHHRCVYTGPGVWKRDQH